jgi:hypothetical protein
MAKDRFGGDTVDEGQTDRFGGSLVEQIPGQRSEYVEAAAAIPEERRIKSPSMLESGLQATAAIPVLGGVSKAAQLASRGSRVAPYATRAAEMFIPRTGGELTRQGALAFLGGSAAQGASNMLPENTGAFPRFLVETGAGLATEGLASSLRSAARGFRPITPGGTERAAERVVRQMTPEQVAALPQTVESKLALVRQAQERLRGKPYDQPLDATEVARLLNIESVAGRQRGEQLSRQLQTGTEQRLAAISQPRTMEQVGGDLRSLAMSRLEKLKADREAATNVNKEAMLNEARTKELAGQGVENTQAFKNAEVQLKAFERDPQTKRELLTSDTKAQFDKVRRELTGVSFDPLTGETKKTKVGFERLERLRRQLGDRASGLPETGYDAIGQKDAKKLKEMVESVMSEFTGKKFDKYIADYKAMSEPINQFESEVGRALTAPSTAVRGELATLASTLPGKIFSKPENIDNLIALAGGDKTRVEVLARNYASTELANKTPAQINSWLRTNSEWLSRFPQLKKDFADFARKQEQTTRVTKQTEKLTEQRAKMFEMGGTQTQQAENFKNLMMGTGSSRDVASAAKVLGRTPEGAAAFKSSVRDLIGTLPPGSIERSYRDRIKPSMQASGLYTPDELRFVDDAIADVVSIQTAISRASQNIGRTPGTESSAQELTRLINNEMSQVKKGGAIAGLYTAGLTALSARFGLPMEVGGTTAAAGAMGGAFAIDRYRQYTANIRAAVSDIVTDPVKLKEVLKSPPDKRQGVLARMIRQTVGTQLGAETPERTQNAPQ